MQDLAKLDKVYKTYEELDTKKERLPLEVVVLF